MKRIHLVSALAATLLAVTACGTSGSSATSSTPTTPGASAPAAASSDAGSDTAGSETAGSDTAGSDTAGSDTAGSDTAGSDTGSSDTAGSGSAGSGSAGSDTSTSSGGSGSDLPAAPGSIKIGSAAFPENVLLAEIYGGAMAAKGVTVTKQLNIGERGVYLAALKGGEIGFVPEYSGSILANLDPKATAKSPEEVAAALKKAAAAAGFATTKYSPAQDADTITVTQKTAAKYKLTSIADLKAAAGQLTLGAPAQFKTRADGIPGLEKVYGVKFGNFTPTDAGGTVTVNALKNGSIDAADIFSTDPAIAANNFVILTDPDSMFAAQNVVPLFSQKVLTQPMADAADAVSEKLDTKTLAGLVAKVSGDNAAQVAQDWLKSVNLG